MHGYFNSAYLLCYVKKNAKDDENRREKINAYEREKERETQRERNEGWREMRDRGRAWNIVETKGVVGGHFVDANDL